MSLHRSQTVAILKKMSPQEMKELGGYINSSFSKATPLMRRAFSFLENCYPDFDKSRCTNELFCQQALQKRLDKKTNKEINRLMSEIRGFCEKYLVIESALGDKVSINNTLTKWYNQRNLGMQVVKSFKEAESMISTDRSVNAFELYKCYLINKVNYHEFKKNTEQSLLLNKQFAQFLHEKYQIDSAIMNIGTSNSIRTLGKKEIERIHSGKPEKEYKVVSFNKEINFFKSEEQFLKSPSKKNYYALKERLTDSKLKIADYDRLRLVILLANSLNNIFLGAEYYEESLAITKVLAKIQMKLYNNFLQAITYRDFILQLCSLNRTGEARSFQKSIGEKLLGVADINNFVSIYSANILYSEKKFYEALTLISQCSGEMLFSSVDIKLLKVKLALKMKNLPLFEANVNNLRKFLSTQGKVQLRARITENILAQLRYAIKLFKIPSSQKNELLAVKQEIKQDSSCYHKHWILEEIDEKLSA